MIVSTTNARASRSRCLRLVGTLLVSLTVIVGLLVIRFAARSENNNNGYATRIVSNEEYAPGMALHPWNCPRTPPREETAGVPVWVAGYPGSGFDVIAPLSAAVTGLTAVDVYHQHTCLLPVESTHIPIGACMTHWPLVEKDAPDAVAARDGVLYQHRAIFLLRNPANAIPSYHTRWWGAQKHIRQNRAQPPPTDWIEWRDKRFPHHLEHWKKSLQEWQRGLPAAGVTGIGLYIPFEDLVREETGPQLAADFANHMESAHHEVASHTSCLWRRIVQQEHELTPKEYRASFTATQKQDMLDMLTELIDVYSITEPQLATILQRYRTDIETNVTLDTNSAATGSASTFKTENGS